MITYRLLNTEKMTINEIQDQVIEEFALFDDWTDKYEYIIDLGKKLPPLDDQYKTEENKIKGCQSTVWLHAELDGDKLLFEAESEAVIVKGLVSLLIRVLSGHTPEEIVQANLYFMERIGMNQHLAQTRSNGLASMVKQMKLYALAYQAKLS
jgi:cysteine desulfuration protein SufE